ncbi:phage tail tape measure protein [Levilactobacillus brevis]|uniref:phage tail tape measure protein n=1 Tax=Levilactobacillus brevis TaxID=1580 RepID=UPI000BEAB203|nr:phage tail tape measure protein [Levilactobacillus brevis]MCZ2118638.1 phage tail tape measure protein [Levilactobacillus brevis]MCZ2124178.1 phage tail tape measure protein [Levilactobacillus brevis]MCZ2208498.1 phage tail tape measure protein [Levilactobacillus brevis]MCZ2323962.1 phage tail tape measure protein [Levilactobacillus brevis]
MAMRKSFIEIGYKVNKSGLTEAKTAVDKLIRSQEKMLNNLDAYDQRNRKIAASQQSVNSELQKTAAYQYQTAKEQAKVTDSVVKTRAEQRKLSEAEGKTRQKAVDTGDSIVRSNEKSARAVNRTRHSTEQASTSFDKLHGAGSRLVNMGSAISMAMLPVAAAFKKSADEATELENKYTTIKNLLHTGGESAGASAAETKQMEKDNNQFALQYGVSPVEMSKGGEELIRRGYSGSQELASHKYFLQAARASGDDYNSVVGYGAPALEQFGYKTKAGDSQKKMAAYTKTVLNQMAYGADLSATDFTGIGNSLRYAGATAHSANQSLAGTIGAVGVLSNNGQDGTVAGTGLRKDINSLMNTTSNGDKALKSIGLSSDDLRDSHNNLLSLDKAFELLNSHMKGMNDTERASVFHSLFGTTGQESALILSKNVDQMKSLTGQVQNAEKQGKGKGYIVDLAQKNMKSWKNQIEVFKQYMNVMGLGFTKTVLPGFTHMLTDTNHVLKALIKLPEPVKDLTGHVVALGSAMAVAYAGSKLLRKGLDWMGGSASTKVGRQTQMVEDVAQTSEGAVPTVSPTRPSVRATTGLRGKWNGLSGMSKLAIAGVGLDVGTQAVGAFKEGIGSKAGGKDLWSAAGKTTGATIGGVLTGGNPVGIMIGEQIGDAFVKVAIPYFTKQDHRSSSNIKDYNKKAKKTGSPDYNQLRTDSYGSGAGTDFSGLSTGDAPYKPHKSQPRKKATNPYSGLSSQTSDFLRSTRKQVQQANSEYLSIMATGSKKAIDQNKNTYTSLLKSVKSYSAKQRESSDSNINYLKKIGAISSAEQAKELQKNKNGDNKRLSAVRNTVTQIEKAEKSGSSNRMALVAKLNGQLLRLTDAGANKQKSIYNKLREGVTSLTSKQYSSVMKQSRQARTQTVADAKKQYESQKESATKSYYKTLSSAKATYGVHSKMYAKIKTYADKQYTDTTNAAHQQYKDTVKWANKSEKAVEKAAANAADGIDEIMGVMSDNITIMGKQLAKAVGGTYSKPVSNEQSIKNNTQPGAQLNKGAQKLRNKTTVLKSGQSAPKMPNAFAGHATGGPIRATQMAMVNEAGTEVAYNPRTGKFRLLGNGPAFTKLFAGEHVINAKDTRKLFSGGLGKGKTLKGYAAGTTSLSSSSVGGSVKAKGFSNPLGSAEKSTKTSMGKISKMVTGGYDKATTKSSKSIKKFGSQSTRDWKGIHGDTKRYTGRIQKETIGDYDQLQKGADKQLVQMKSSQLATMSKIHNGMNSETKAIESDFNSIMGKLPGDAKDAMKGSITSLNGGFTAIDSALSQFGGNKSVLKPIHYAQGSRGPIDNDQLAVLNDANSGPRQELVARGQQLIKPVGDNVAVHLRKGDEVFNGDQVERAKPYLPHFKKGTGASDSKLKSLAKANSANPAKSFSNEFTANAKPTGSTLQKGVTNVANTGAKKVGVPWSSAMWGLIQDTIEGGTAAGGKWIHTPGLALTNGFGAARSFGSHDGNDFSGPLGSAILAMHGGKVVQIGRPGHGWPYSQLGDIIELDSDDGYHQIYQEFGGMNNIKVAVGDVVKTGQRIATLGHLNGAGSGAHVHVGLAHGSVWDHGGSSTKGWLDITKMRGGSDASSKLKSSSKPKANSALTKLVKSQLGSSAIKWIEKNLQDDIGSADVGALGGSVASRARTLAKAIKSMYGPATKAGIAAVLGNWEFESGLNPGAINPGGGASGLGQWLGGRKSALINFAKKNGGNWKSAGTQLAFALKGDGSDSSVLKSVLSGTGSVASLAAKFSSQWERGGYTAQHVAGARKIEAALGTGGQAQIGKNTLVGEHGPELVNFDRPATIRSADATRQLANKAGAKSKPSIQNTFHIDLKIEVKSGDAKEIAKNVKSALRDELDNLFSTELENLDY